MKKRDILFGLLAEVQPPRALYDAIMTRVAYLERRSARVRAGIFGAFTLVFAAALVPALQYGVQQFYTSGFYDYASLMFSDHSLVLTYWREFSLSLVESLPAVALLLILPIVAALMWSLVRTIQTARIALTYGNI